MATFFLRKRQHCHPFRISQPAQVEEGGNLPIDADSMHKTPDLCTTDDLSQSGLSQLFFCEALPTLGQRED